MYPLFETLCIENGKIQNIDLHQARYERSLREYYGKSAVKIFNLFSLIQLPAPLQNQLVRCRIDYNAETTQIQYFEYYRKIYRTFQPIIFDDIEYGLKYSDRSLINTFKNGKVTDCSIGNLIFRQGGKWYTPDTPLLLGTQREKLLQEGKIQETTIFQEDIVNFDEIKIINAMNSL